MHDAWALLRVPMAVGLAAGLAMGWFGASGCDPDSGDAGLSDLGGADVSQTDSVSADTGAQDSAESDGGLPDGTASDTMQPDGSVDSVDAAVDGVADAEPDGEGDAPQDAGPDAVADVEPLDIVDVQADADADADADAGFIPDEDYYILFSPVPGPDTYLIDQSFQLVHGWTAPTPPGNSVYLTRDGVLIRTGRIATDYFDAGGAGGLVYAYAWDNTLLWSHAIASPEQHHHHDVIALANGNVIFLVWQMRSADEALAAGRHPEKVTADGVWSERLVEWDPVAEQIVWEWDVWDHLVQDAHPNAANYVETTAAYPHRVDLNYGLNAHAADLWHANSISYNEQLDQIAISARFTSEFWVIDHGTTTDEAKTGAGGTYGRGGDILYRWGNPEAYKRGGPQDRQLYGQHDVRWVPPNYPGAGNITLFNNGHDELRPYSTVVEIVPPILDDGTYALAEGEPFGPAAPVWEYAADPPESFYADRISGANRLADGHTLVCDGPVGRMFEVTPDGEILTEYEYGGFAFRADSYPSNYPAFADKVLEPQGSVPSPLSL